MNIFRPLFFAAALSAACASGCGSSSAGEVVDEGKAVSGIDINPNQDITSTGATMDFRATARYADGTTKDVTDEVVWNSSAPSVATVSKDGKVTTLRPGLVEITADYKGAKGNERFVVRP